MRSWNLSAVALRIALFVPTLLIAPHAALAQTASIKVMTYNTHHGGTSTTPPTTDFQLDMIAAENPDVVVLQEAYSSQFATYVNGLNVRQNTTAWHGAYNKTCKEGVEPTCTRYTSESVMILTKLKTLAVTPRLIWAKDAYHVARATLRMSMALSDGTPVNVFVCHLPALSSGAAARSVYVNTFLTWAATFGGPKLVGGDFNDSPSSAPILAMKQVYADAWALGGTGNGYTHMQSGSLTPVTRIDYWFSEKAAPIALNSVAVTGSPTDSDHLAVVADYSVAPVPSSDGDILVPATVQTTLFADRFDSFDATQWPGGVITGTRDTTVPVSVTGGRLQIGPLKSATTGTHYNGISSIGYNLATSGCASVQLAQGLNPATTAYAMFALVRDTNNLYRWYQSGGTLVAEKKIGGVKTTLANLQYDAAAQQFLRVRKVTNTATGTEDVVFETAVNNAGVPGAYVERYRNTWDAAVNAASLKVELKAGTSVAVNTPGQAIFDNVLVASHCK
jgi:endonuclease/exonuclease/phosphatase family metal-dependent hydrolase